MADLDITFSDAGFPDPFAGDNQDLVDAFAENLAATIDDTSIITGQDGGSIPLTNIGPLWINGTSIYVWSGSAYVPAVIKIADSGFLITLGSETLTGNRSITFQDAAGVVALQSDVFDTRGTIVKTGTTPIYNWSNSFSFFQSIGAATTATFAESLPGQTITCIVSASGSFAMNWPAIVNWAGGSPPSQTASGTDMYIFSNIAGTIYGQYEADFS